MKYNSWSGSYPFLNSAAFLDETNFFVPETTGGALANKLKTTSNLETKSAPDGSFSVAAIFTL